MNNTPDPGRGTGLVFALGLAADVASARAPDASGVIGETGPWGTYKTVCSFGTDIGRYPTGVMRASDGLVYGTTMEGGAYARGTLYCVDAHRRVHVLHSFGESPADGFLPTAPPTEGKDGALYGLTYRGGAAGLGVAWRLGRGGRWDILHSFGAAREDGAGCHGSLVLASDGELYGTSSAGGVHRRGVVFRLGKDGTVTPLWQLGKPREPASPMAALIEGADGGLYGTSTAGGRDDCGTVFSVARDGSQARVLHSFQFPVEWIPYAGLVQGTNGYLYGTTRRGSLYGRVYRLSPDGMEYSVLYIFDYPDGKDAAAPLLEIEPGVFVGTTSRTYAGTPGGSLFAILADGGFRSLRQFGYTVRGLPDGLAPIGPMCRLPSGELVGTCSTGGTADVGTLWFARAPDA